MADIRSRPSTDTYRREHDRIFGHIADVRDSCPVYDGYSDCICGEHEPLPLPVPGHLPLPMDLYIGRPQQGWTFAPPIVVRGAAIDPLNRAIQKMQRDRRIATESYDSHPQAD